MRNHASRWTLAVAVMLAGIGYSAAAAPAEAFSFRDARKAVEKQRKEQKKYYEKQQKYYKKQQKAERKQYERYLKDQRRAARYHPVPYAAPYYPAPQYVAPAPVYPGGYGVEYPAYYAAPSRGFSFGFDMARRGGGFGFDFDYQR
jgi:hypothetical protein